MGANSPAIPLLIRFGRVGDMVLQTPLLHLLHHRFGHPCRLLTSGPWSVALFAGNPDVGELWQLQDRHAPFLLSPERWRMVRLLHQHRGPVYISEDSQRQLPKIRRLLALGGVGNDRCVYLDQIPHTDDEHWIDQLLRLGQTTPQVFDAPQALPEALWASPQLYVRPCDRDDREAWLRQRGFSGRPLVILQPGNKRAIKWGRARPDDSKAWPIARWAGFMQAMHAHLPDGIFLLCGSPAEQSLLQEIRAAATVDRVTIATHELPLRRLLAVLETAHSMISVDTGPAHIAAAVGCPLVVLYGAESRKRWSRRSASGRPVIELGGAPNLTAEDIPLESVVQAWMDVQVAATTNPALAYVQKHAEIVSVDLSARSTLA